MASEALKFAACLTLVASTITVCSAEDVYKHVGGGNFSYTTSAEYGDEVILAGTARVLTGISFEYAANYASTAGLTFRLYDQTGPLISGSASPGVTIYEKTMDILNGGATVNINFGLDWSNVLPDRLTYTVQFTGLIPGNTAGLIAPGGIPVVGLSGEDFWEKTGPGANDWALKAFGPGSPTENFVTTITAVPEPSTVAMMVAGAGLVLVALRRK